LDGTLGPLNDRSDLFANLSGLVLRSPNSTLIGIGVLREAIDVLRKHGLVILGMEGFRTDGRRIIPMVQFVADFSQLQSAGRRLVDDSAAAALRVAAHWTDGPQFVEFQVAELK
jgi:hypothetical protein